MRIYKYEKNMHTGIAHLKEKSQSRAHTTSNELTHQEAYTRGDSCIGRPVIVGQNQENGGGKKTDLYDRIVSLNVT